MADKHTRDLMHMKVRDITDIVGIATDEVEDGRELVDPLAQRKPEPVEVEPRIPEFKKNSLLCLSPTNPVRRLFINIVYNKWFDRFIISAILVNCFFLAINDPLCSRLPRSEIDLEKNRHICSDTAKATYVLAETAESIFLIIFTVEAAFKIIACGLVRERSISYLRDAWNWLDFVVVVIGWVSLLPGVENLSALRTFRVLRPLRTLTTIPGMRIIIRSMFQAGAQLGMVGLLWLFVFFVFGIVGIQFWAGLFEGRCHLVIHGNDSTMTYELDSNDELLCALTSASGSGCDGIDTTCSPVAGRVCGPAMYGPGNTTFDRVCRRIAREDGPANGFGNFDNIGFAIITVFTSITLEGWVDNMYNVLDTFGRWYFTVPYFILLIMFGSFFLLNLALAVIWLEYDRISESDKFVDKLKQQQIRDDPNLLARMEKAKKEKEQAKKDRMRPDPCCKASCGCLTRLVMHPAFEMVVTVLIIFNTISLGLEHAGMSDLFIEILKYVNIFFTAVFLGEMVLKLIGLGPRVYVRDNFNLFDAFVVAISIAELLLEYTGIASGSGLSVFRTFRLFRVFKLVRSWEDLRELLHTIVLSLKKVSTASVLLLIIIFIFGLVGMQFYAGEFTVCAGGTTSGNVTGNATDAPVTCFEELPRAHFDNLFWSIVTVFQVLTGENWNEVLYNGMKVAPITSTFYFMTLSVVGNYVILNLFLAILLEQFEQEDLDDAMRKEKEELMLDRNLKAQEEADRQRRRTEFHQQRQKLKEQSQEKNDSPGASEVRGWTAAQVGPTSVVPTNGAKPTSQTGGKPRIRLPPEGSSLLVLKQRNPLRVAMYRFVDWKLFDHFILLLIGISSILLALDEPYLAYCETAECATLKSILVWSDLVLTGLFSLEMLLKIIALGFAFHPGAYWRSGWNALDGTIVIISIMSVLLEGNKSVKALRSLRALRGLRPLRVVRRYPGMKLVVNAIFRAAPKIMNVALVTAFFFVIFGIVGVQNWKGTLNTCNDESITAKSECVGEFPIEGDLCSMLPNPVKIQACIEQLENETIMFQRDWAPLPVNFDHIGAAMLSVFEITSGEMWPDIMYSVVDADTSAENLPLSREKNPAAAIYFMAVIVVCSFLMLNVFVGVVIDNFNKMKEDEEGSALMTTQQKKWVEHMRFAMQAKPLYQNPAPEAGWRRKLFNLVESKRFEWFIMWAIIANTCLMASRHSKQPAWWDFALSYGNMGFAALFAIEALMKITALGWRAYFRRKWNRFDFVLVVLSFVGMIGSIGGIASIFRIFRVARIFRLVKTLKGLQILFQTLLIALPSVFNVGTILLLLHFIAAVMAMNVFAPIKLQENLNEHANFQGFGISMITLFRVSTGESYNALMHDCRIGAPYCEQGTWIDADMNVRDSNCGQHTFSPFFFCLFFVASNYVLLNLLVAIIIDSLVMVANMNSGVVTPEDIEEFRTGWRDLDPDGDSLIPVDNVLDLIMQVRWPLGLRDSPGSRRMSTRALRKHAEKMMMQLNIRNYHGEVHFHDTILALMDRAMGNVRFHEEAVHAKEKIQTHVETRALKVRRKQSMRRKTAVLPVSFDYTIAEEFAARKIQYAFRKYKGAKRRKLIFKGS